MKTNSVAPSSSNPELNPTLPAHQLDARAEGLRLPWSRWSRCESTFSLLLVPPRAGVFVLAEDVLAADVATDAREDGGGRRMLAVFYVGEAEDLSRSLGRLFAATSPLREKLATSRCYLRFAPVEDAAWRNSVALALGKWFTEAAAAASSAIQTAPATSNMNDVPQSAASVGGTTYMRLPDANLGTALTSEVTVSPLIDCDPGDEHSDVARPTASTSGHYTEPSGDAATDVATQRRRPAPPPAGF